MSTNGDARMKKARAGKHALKEILVRGNNKSNSKVLDMTQAEYYMNKGTLREKFSSEFLEKAKTNPTANSILETLIRQDNPYMLIEQLVSQQEAMAEEIKRLVFNMPPNFY
jgi:hypothetical protein